MCLYRKCLLSIALFLSLLMAYLSLLCQCHVLHNNQDFVTIGTASTPSSPQVQPRSPLSPAKCFHGSVKEKAGIGNRRSIRRGSHRKSADSTAMEDDDGGMMLSSRASRKFAKKVFPLFIAIHFTSFA